MCHAKTHTLINTHSETRVRALVELSPDHTQLWDWVFHVATRVFFARDFSRLLLLLAIGIGRRYCLFIVVSGLFGLCFWAFGFCFSHFTNILSLLLFAFTILFIRKHLKSNYLSLFCFSLFFFLYFWFVNWFATATNRNYVQPLHQLLNCVNADN